MAKEKSSMKLKKKKKIDYLFNETLRIAFVRLDDL